MRLRHPGVAAMVRKDRLTVEQRSENMRAIKAFGTKPEQVVELWIRKLKIHHRKHDHNLPGRPDFVFPQSKRIILVHGDFWHGWRFSTWRNRLPKKYWRTKIERNRKNDLRNRRQLRRLGWQVLILWEHQIRRAPEPTFEKLRAFLYSDASAGDASSR
jgi:DNA mismatch endonuclease (patch repair protein)